MQFKIPQNVQREDTIIGPLTMKQMIICSIGGGICYIIYLSLSKKYFMEIWLPPIIIITAITMAFAFVKINTMPFYQFIMHSIEHYFKPRRRTWQQSSGDLFISQISTTLIKPKQNTKTLNKKEKAKTTLKDLNKLTKILDSHGTNKN